MIKNIYFDWYGVSENNSESFGQITFMDADDEKVGVVNLDLKYEDLFLLIFELIEKHIDVDINVVYEKVI